MISDKRLAEEMRRAEWEVWRCLASGNLLQAAVWLGKWRFCRDVSGQHEGSAEAGPDLLAPVREIAQHRLRELEQQQVEGGQKRWWEG